MDNKYVTTGQIAGGGFLMWLSSLDLASLSYIVGISVAVIGLIGSLYWQWRKDSRERQVNAAILKAIQERGVNVTAEHLD